jgi:hypothetical protein
VLNIASALLSSGSMLAVKDRHTTATGLLFTLVSVFGF